MLLIINLMDVMLGVFARFYRPPMWTTDLAKITLVWCVMLAAAPALKRGEHMAIYIIVNKLPKLPRKFIACARGMVFMGILLFMTIYGFAYAEKLSLFTIMTLGIKKNIPLLAIPVGMGLMLVQYVLQILVDVTDKDAARRQLQ
ncbi:MAG: TRAP transporter small permease [Desulfovibrionales bacterium]|nr:TRAP transporter small permease [Desulfovibrionales bacterium]